MAAVRKFEGNKAYLVQPSVIIGRAASARGRLWQKVGLGLIVSALASACSDRASPPNEHASNALASLQRQLARIEHLSGQIEGVYSVFNFEGSSFQFCSREECPDEQMPICVPEFTEQARRRMGALVDIEDGASIQLRVAGKVRTVLSPGGRRGFGPDKEMCEILITEVRAAQVMGARMVRSKKYPEDVKPFGSR